jgi:hypothetical protein
MPNSRIKRDIDWFFETPPTGDPIINVQAWLSGTDSALATTVATSTLPNKFFIVEIYWENDTPFTVPTVVSLNGQNGTLLTSTQVDNGAFENGLYFFYWTDTQIQAITAISNNPNLSVTWSNGDPIEFQFSYIQYANVAQSNFLIDVENQTNVGNLNFTDSLVVEDGGVIVVSNVSGNAPSSTVTTLTPFPLVVDDLSGVSQNANVWEEFTTTNGPLSFTFNISGSTNRTAVSYFSLRRA